MSTSIILENQTEEKINDFLPILLKVEISADMVEKGDELLIKSWWQNIGEMTAGKLLKGSIDFEFGNQRNLEHSQKEYRISWNPFPAIHTWEKGEIWSTTCRWKIPELWGGTYKLFISLCDEAKNPVTIGGRESQGKRIYVGEIDVGWGWGRPALELMRKSFTVEFNQAHRFIKEKFENHKEERIVIGENIKVYELKKCLVILRINDGKAYFSFPYTKPEVIIRNFTQDDLIFSFGTDVTISYTNKHKDVNSMVYSAQAFYKAEIMAEWNLEFSVIDRALSITLSEIKEYGNYELLEVRLPTVISASGSDVRMVDFFGGGRLISPDSSATVGFEHLYDVRNAAAIFNSNGTLVIESPRLDDKLYQSVQENAS